MNVQVTVDTAAAQRELSVLGRHGTLAIARALNRTIRSGQTQAVRAIAADTGLAQKHVRDGVTVELAARDRLLGRLLVSTERIVLYAFKARQVRAGVTYRLGSGGRGFVPGAFISRMRSGHVGVFRRRGRARLPIVELRGPSLGRVFAVKVAQSLKDAVGLIFQKNLDHEIDFLRRSGR